MCFFATVSTALLSWSATALADAATAMVDQPYAPLQSPPPAPFASQRSTHQLNQLFQFESTPDICAAGEGYVSGQFNVMGGYYGAGRDGHFENYDGGIEYYGINKGEQYRYQVQGQYGITDQIAVGGFLPIVSNSGIDTGVGNFDIYGQYKLDKIVDPKYLNLTAQLDLVFPTGDSGRFRDEGTFGVRPLLLAYKDFGLRGPGILGLYGLFGATIRSNSDVRLGIGATYEYEHFVGVAELTNSDPLSSGPSLTIFEPGLIYRGVKSFELAFGVPLGIGYKSPDWGVTLKVTYVFAK